MTAPAQTLPEGVREQVDDFTLQSSIYEGFSTEIWADNRPPGQRTVAIVRDYRDAVRILAALSAVPSPPKDQGSYGASDEACVSAAPPTPAAPAADLAEAARLLTFVQRRALAISPQCGGGWVIEDSVSLGDDAQEFDLVRTRGSLIEALREAEEEELDREPWRAKAAAPPTSEGPSAWRPDEGELAEALERAFADCGQLIPTPSAGAINMLGRHMVHHLADVRREFAEAEVQRNAELDAAAAPPAPSHGGSAAKASEAQQEQHLTSPPLAGEPG